MLYDVGGRITLRPIEVWDDAHVVLWRNRDRAAFFSSEVVTPDTHKAFVEHRKPHDLVWIAVLRDNGPVGMVSLTVNVKDASAEFGRLYVGPDSRNKGLGVEITYTAMSFGFDVLSLRGLWLITRPGDMSALRVYQKTGWCARRVTKDRVYMDYHAVLWPNGRKQLRQLLEALRVNSHIDTIQQA